MQHYRRWFCLLNLITPSHQNFLNLITPSHQHFLNLITPSHQHFLNWMTESHQNVLNCESPTFNGMNQLILGWKTLERCVFVICVPVAGLNSFISFQRFPNVPSLSSSLSFLKSIFAIVATDYWGYLFGENDDETLRSHAMRKWKFSTSGVGAKHKFSLFWSNWETPINLSSHETPHGYILNIYT